ncbi:MAG: signal recognition particle-docking protein FtsY [Betaproteobacteria bacterium]|nr:MAG: signal recognition particle-docking protein FtsY [Betaproteobacteria bacterium]
MLELSSKIARGEVSWVTRLRDGLGITRSRLSGLFTDRTVDPALLEEIETALLASDAGAEATRFLLANLRERAGRVETGEQLKSALREMLVELLAPLEQALDLSGKKPRIIMLAGVNGAGKTTSIGKLARYFQNRGLSVLLAAGDTFRAAAREQLAAWGEKNSVVVVAQSGGDPGAVVYDAVAAARSRGIDVVIADTAGRLPTQLHLMEEIGRIKRVIAKAEPGAPHEVWLVLDANTGQNALNQVKAFDDALGLTGLILTKLDGTAKGGVVCAIARQRPLPLRFIGVGEGSDDLRPFAADEFVSALLD